MNSGSSGRSQSKPLTNASSTASRRRFSSYSWTSSSEEVAAERAAVAPTVSSEAIEEVPSEDELSSADSTSGL